MEAHNAYLQGHFYFQPSQSRKTIARQSAFFDQGQSASISDYALAYAEAFLRPGLGSAILSSEKEGRRLGRPAGQ